jgi:hypothetical protein
LCSPTPLCSPEMVELLCWMLRPFAKDRPQSCDQVAAALYQMSRTPARTTVGDTQVGKISSNAQAPTMHVPSTYQTAPPGEVAPAQPAATAAVISDDDALVAEKALTEHMGPIAKVLVKKAANNAASKTDFIERLADDIDDPQARQEFISSLKR